MTFDFIIILSAAAENIDGEFPNFLNGMYLGGEVRVNAAAKLLHEYPETKFIVAGGYNEKNIGIAGTSKKVDDIVGFLKASNPHGMIQEIYSLPCTHHNFVAVFNYWKRNRINPRRVGVLSNEYHLPRAIAFADILSQTILPDSKITFVPIAAEAVDTNFALKFDDDVSQAAYSRRLEHEEAGLEKLNTGDYTDYCLTRDFELLKGLIYESPDNLLTDEEKLALKLN